MTIPTHILTDAECLALLAEAGIDYEQEVRALECREALEWVLQQPKETNAYGGGTA